MTIQQILNSLIPSKAWGASVLLAAGDKNKEELHQCGTGTLLKVAEDYFIVTANHVPTFKKASEKILCVALGDSFVQLYGDWYYPKNEVLDIAVLRVPKDIASKFSETSYVRLQDIEFGSSLSNGVFCLLGYPYRLTNPSTPTNTIMQVKPFQYITTIYDGETTNLDKYQEAYHFLLAAQDGGTDINGQSVYFSDRNGIPLQFPKELYGVSGCSIWKLGNHDKSPSNWQQNQCKIVAVQTAVYSDAKVIKATRWSVVSTHLYQAYPDLRPALNLLRVEY